VTGAIRELFAKEKSTLEVEVKKRSSYAASDSDLDMDNLRELAECLVEFAEKQFGFFYDGFVGSDLDEGRPKHKDFLLNHSREFPPEYVFRVTLDQVAEDLEVIRRAADQRRSEIVAQSLKKADKLVWSALKPVVGPGKLVDDEEPPETPKPVTDEKLPKTTVLSYFQKSASIRVVPYAPVALIGIPFAAASVPRDYLAIPHEVGHYVYRHGKVRINGELKSIPQVLGRRLLEQVERNQDKERAILGKELWNQLNPEYDPDNPKLDPPVPSPRYVRRWKEEIFADVYGCLVGGPIAALSFRDLMLQSSRYAVIQTPAEYLYGQFTEDDGVHPVPVLRPYVYTMTLRVIDGLQHGNLWQWADVLDKQWQAFPQVQEDTEFRTRYAGPAPQYISVAKTLMEVYRVVNEVLNLLPIDDFAKSRWSGLEDPEKVDTLYKQFEETGVEELINSTVLRPAKLKCSTDLWENWVKQENFFPGIGKPPQETEPGSPDKLIPVPIDPGKAQRLEELEQEPRYTWNHIFLAGGWNTKGNGTSGTGVVTPKNWQVGNAAGGSGTY
jgi:hypothetical protein